MENKKKANRKNPQLYRFPALPCIRYIFKDCSTCAEIKILKYCSKMWYCRWCSSRHGKKKNLPYFGLSGMWRNCEERLFLFVLISINGSPLSNLIAKQKEKGSRWNWIPWFIVLDKPSLLWSDLLRAGFIFVFCKVSFWILCWPFKGVYKKISFATPLLKRCYILVK